MADVDTDIRYASVRAVKPRFADQIRRSARRTLQIERDALTALLDALDDPHLRQAVPQAVELILACRGRLVVTGMGKSGIIGRKVSATFASTGTPSLFLHPADASHGDLGMIGRDDIVLAFSRSGETAELSDVVGFCRRFDVPLIAVTENPASSLARQAHSRLIVPPMPEACPNRLAPTSSTIMQLAIGDALAVALLDLRGFSASDFHVFHPRGTLAAQLMTLEQLMATGDDVPRVSLEATILEAMLEMTRTRFGITAIVDAGGRLAGSFTDGDLRRTAGAYPLSDRVEPHVSHSPFRALPSMLATEALALMNGQQISKLFVCSEDEELIGIVQMHDIVRAGIL